MLWSALDVAERIHLTSSKPAFCHNHSILENVSVALNVVIYKHPAKDNLSILVVQDSISIFHSILPRAQEVFTTVLISIILSPSSVLSILVIKANLRY